MSSPNRVLVELRTSTAIRAAESRANLRPLYDRAPSAGSPFAPAAALPLASTPADAVWYLADLPDGAATPWDLAHARVADQLGVAKSDVLFVEPDLVHDIYQQDPRERAPNAPFALRTDCASIPQDGGHGKPVGNPARGWHLGPDYSQLGRARDVVAFSDPRTRIAHLDTGYYRRHSTLPEHLRRDLERNFVLEDDEPSNAQDPDNRVPLLDNSGHGTGTLGILAGKRGTGWEQALGGAPGAEIVPLRIADRVVLLGTSAFARALRHAVDQRCDVVSMSMGGLPSRAWREAVDRAYLAGVCVVCAAGNNLNGVPTRHVVYPARYKRVIAVCGVMANHQPYAGLDGVVLEGNSGPKSVIRALDYLPPVDVTFFEYLRGLITADFDLVRDDHYNYRVAFVEAFRRRGIYPLNLHAPSADTLRTVSVDTVRWRGLDAFDVPAGVRKEIEDPNGPIIGELRRFAGDCFYIKSRELLFETTRAHRKHLRRQLEALKNAPALAKVLGLDPTLDFEVHELRRALRVNAEGRHIPQIIVALTQSRWIPENPADGTPGFTFSGGATLVVDLSLPAVQYAIVKDSHSKSRQERTAEFIRNTAADPLRALFFGAGRREPFAALHALSGEEG